MSTTSMTNLGPLTTTYTPSGANCDSVYITNPGNILVYGTTDAAVSSCLPNSFNGNANFFYSPGICPTGYDYACSAGLGDGATAATCCPTGYVCRKGRVATDTGACQSTLQTDSSFTVLAFTGTGTSSLVTEFYGAGNLIYAKGVVIRRDSDDPAWGASSSAISTTASAAATSGSTASTATSSATTAAQSSSDGGGSGTDSGLSTGAKAGIGIGVALGALIVIGALVAAFVIARRKRRAADAQSPQDYPPPEYHQQNTPHQGYSLQPYVDPYSKRPIESGPVGNGGDYSAARPAELEDQRRFSELHGQSSPQPVELMGN